MWNLSLKIFTEIPLGSIGPQRSLTFAKLIVFSSSSKTYSIITRCNFCLHQKAAADKLAAVRDMWQAFVSQLPKVIMPGSDITVGEQLVPFRGKYPFRKYIPSIPAK